MNISVLRAGEGRDLLFLHGYLASKESFLPQIEYFSRNFRVTAFDFPGFGQSDPIPAACDRPFLRRKGGGEVPFAGGTLRPRGAVRVRGDPPEADAMLLCAGVHL